MRRLYLDEDSASHSVVRALRARGVDVMTTLEAGMVGRDDAGHLEFATSQGRVLCSFNVADFYRIHGEWLEAGKSHAGIILVSQQRYSIGELSRRLLKLAAMKSAETMRDGDCIGTVLMKAKEKSEGKRQKPETVPAGMLPPSPLPSHRWLMKGRSTE